MVDIYKDCCLKPQRWYCDCPGPEPEPEGIDSNLIAMATVPCTYLGDMLSNASERVVSAVSYHNGKMYLLSIQRGTVSGSTGWITIYDVNTNARLVDKVIPYVAHGNGMCWDDKRKQFIITPVFQTAATNSGRNYNLVIADEDFNSVSQLAISDTVGTPINAMSVSYDYAAKKTYVYAYEAHTIYEYTGNPQLTKVSNIGFINHGFDMNQGFAVKDGIYYLSSPKSNFIIGSVATGAILGEKVVANIDDLGRRWLGELQDWEFDEEGVLYTTRNSIFCNSNTERETPGWISNIIAAVSVDQFILPSWFKLNSWEKHNEAFTLGHYTFTFNPTTDFWISINNIRRPEQLDMLVLDSDAKITINFHNEAINAYPLDVVMVNRPQFWHIGGGAGRLINVKRIYVYAPLVIYSANPGCGLVFPQPYLTGDDVIIDGVGALTIANNDAAQNVWINMGSNKQAFKIGVSYIMPTVKIRSVPRININGYNPPDPDSSLLQIGGRTFEHARGLWIGSTQIWDPAAQ